MTPELSPESLKAIHSYARVWTFRYRLRPEDQEDLEQEGILAALVALTRFDPSRSPDPQRFARTRASYRIRELAEQLSRLGSHYLTNQEATDE